MSAMKLENPQEALAGCTASMFTGTPPYHKYTSFIRSSLELIPVSLASETTSGSMYPGLGHQAGLYDEAKASS